MKKIYLVGTKHRTKESGTITILQEFPRNLVLVVFDNTKKTKICNKSNITKGRIKDNYAPLFHGVGFIGEGDYQSMTNYKPNKAHEVWRGMIARCYCDKYQARYPTYKGCSVVNEWHDFQVFAKWFYRMYTKGCHLDKDIKIDGNKVYGPDTCLFVSPQENQEKAIAKSYKIRSPLGVVFSVYNLSKFCKDNHLGDYSSLRRAATGEKPHHKGWTKA